MPEEILRILCQHLADFQTKFSLRWWVGLGRNYFVHFGLPIPNELERISFNGDREAGVRYEDADILCIFGGAWESTINVARLTKKYSADLGIDMIGLDLGYTGDSCRGHSGFIEGTSNLQELSEDELTKCVFVQGDGDNPNAPGSYLLFRKYEENVDLWEDLPESIQEQIIGRRKQTGKFLNDEDEWSAQAWGSTNCNAHIRLVNPRSQDQTWQDRIYRRSIQFTEPTPTGPRRGLLFLALCRSPLQQILRIHNSRLLPTDGRQDLLLSSGYVKPILSGLYFLPKQLPPF